jgi:hypothetical protein
MLQWARAQFGRLTSDAASPRHIPRPLLKETYQSTTTAVGVCVLQRPTYQSQNCSNPTLAISAFSKDLKLPF